MRTRWIFAASLVVAAAFPSNANAGDGWRVVDTAGVVRIGGPGFMPAALTRDQELPADAWIETKAGRAVLVRGQESMVIEPNSRVMLPGSPVNGNTQVLQSMGSAIYKIGKQKQPHFQVDTPYMAAVVKGTAFTVSVSDDEAAVTVTEGLVEVSTPDMGDVEFVRPGFTALVSRDNMKEIVIDRSQAADTPSSPVIPKSDGTNTQAVVIPAAIGDVEVDVNEVSGGLVSGEDVRLDTELVKSGGGKGEASSGEHANKPKDDVVLIDDAGPADPTPKSGRPMDIVVTSDPVVDLPVDSVVDDIRKANPGKALGHLKNGGPT